MEKEAQASVMEKEEQGSGKHNESRLKDEPESERELPTVSTCKEGSAFVTTRAKE